MLGVLARQSVAAGIVTVIDANTSKAKQIRVMEDCDGEGRKRL
ncbi:hypothetical protein X739_01770 [Mesorhizobium sp. LNHC220B00]|nr:hypothetical protein X739_01770 [Mesorhizobium sp. LNHC220B00]ESZ00064.1 hypothetical protein X738_09270 [Mesorhizobium sp. LNHC209A00]